jgi:hypothetical protein
VLLAKLASVVVLVSSTAVVVGRVATAPAPRPLPPATAEQRARFAATVASREEQWQREAAVDFPADRWSQRDAFHGHEAATVRELAGGAGVSYEDVFRAIDQDLHQTRARAPGSRDRSAGAVPCKPRPVFD